MGGIWPETAVARAATSGGTLFGHNRKAPVYSNNTECLGDQ